VTEHAAVGLIVRAQAVVNELDIKSSTMQSWQAAAVHLHLGQIEKVLKGERRGQPRRAS